ncbi:hypothetical protein BDW02DRAFT_23486 [Decorospora gaudefroyi]|uniref:Uncharacterized protein n=1 Tax=Decorospora gaudefroyi TaxID=184978 RepID=A0A6A5K2Y4_9PLEO|nr:hypothetical protein BDW02DRAFT_23486 [Decorospora gaudefroyi]
MFISLIEKPHAMAEPVACGYAQPRGVPKAIGEGRKRLKIPRHVPASLKPDRESRRPNANYASQSGGPSSWHSHMMTRFKLCDSVSLTMSQMAFQSHSTVQSYSSQTAQTPLSQRVWLLPVAGEMCFTSSDVLDIFRRIRNPRNPSPDLCTLPQSSLSRTPRVAATRH